MINPLAQADRIAHKLHLPRSARAVSPTMAELVAVRPNVGPFDDLRLVATATGRCAIGQWIDHDSIVLHEFGAREFPISHLSPPLRRLSEVRVLLSADDAFCGNRSHMRANRNIQTSFRARLPEILIDRSHIGLQITALDKRHDPRPDRSDLLKCMSMRHWFAPLYFYV